MRVERLIRTLVGIVGATLILLSVGISQKDNYVPLLMFSSIITVPVFLCGLFGAVIAYWKRRFGGVFLLLVGLSGFLVIFVGGGVWALLGSVVLVGCAISAFWHRLSD